MEIRVLGCHGSQFPGYNTTSFLLNGKILVDAGTVTSVLTDEEQANIDHILVTHAHLDHVRDIMFLADNICYFEKDRPLVVISTANIIDALKTCLFNDVIWPDFGSIPHPDRPILKFQVIEPGRKIKIEDLHVSVVRVHHIVETMAFIIESAKGSVIFLGDTGPTDEIWKVANDLGNLKAIFIETSLPNIMKDVADRTGHLTPSSLEEELKKLEAHKTDIYIYHMKRHHQKSIQEEIALIRNRSIRILEDGQVIRL
ncbi:MAG: 3',5'-cyclic-nucleotide phosphodiesterase [Deltaproteobacteria bacterium]|nr:3',5'-cyclic-nucleotide phosphodiesterase [Deltaproteobacteria bacterium]